MIVYTRDDMVRLSGALIKNQWLTIKAAANLLIQDHPQGIIIDCSELTHVSAEGAKTFLDAIRDITGAGARIIVASLPDEVTSVLRAVPGVRSQLPVAATIEEARASLNFSISAPTEAERNAGGTTILVPLFEGLDIDYAVAIAARIAHDQHLSVTFAVLLVVARNLPLGTPLREEEETANRLLEQAMAAARRANIQPSRHIERVRGVEEGLLQIIKTYKAMHVIVTAAAGRVNEEPFANLIDVLLHRAPCNVVIGRSAPKNGESHNV